MCVYLLHRDKLRKWRMMRELDVTEPRREKSITKRRYHHLRGHIWLIFKLASLRGISC